MNRGDLKAQLQRAESRDDLAGDRRLLNNARPAFDAAWLDASLREALERLATRCKEDITLGSPRPLEPGETWLLLAERPGVGDVVRASVSAGRPNSAPRAQREVDRAVKGIAAAVTEAERLLPSEWFGATLEIPQEPHLDIVGDSLGLAVAVAMISSATCVRPRNDTAGTASVDSSGRLQPIDHLAEKCDALRRLWPHVNRVVVADAQVIPARLDGFEFVRAPGLADALAEFGLDLRAVKPRRAGDLRTRLAAIEHEEESSHTTSRWISLATEAWEVGRGLAALKDHDAGRAVLVSALLTSHAGDNELAIERLVALPDSALRSAGLRARKAIYLASFTIDVDATRAAELARSALSLTGALPDEADQLGLAGRALGTLGRALMAAGVYAEAELHLRRAVEHHQAHAEGEVARSMCYLACCLRLMGRREEALHEAERALDLATKHRADFQVSQTSERYALLERGRALLVLGRVEEAVQALERVVGHESPEASYPALGARRSLSIALQLQGRHEDALKMVQLCARVARGGAPLTLRRVGAVAAAEALLLARDHRRPSPLPQADVMALWTECFGDASMIDVVRTWLY